MRLKIIVPILVCAVVLIGSAVFFARPSLPAPPVPAPVSASETSQKPAQAQTAAEPAPRRWQSEPRPAPPSEEELAKSKQTEEETVQSRIHELNDLAMSGDPKSLRAILAELNNPEAELRRAAVDAAVQFESQDAIPALKDALAQAADLDEMEHLHKAIEFLSNVSPPEATAVQANSR